ncbi:type II toxin-antitoxin system VapC family toxin [Candidatus Woesearchaeota archaeon]|nr:type II toxin-antitoxin system VapC family toxin [Candidatus Woesearchaeota archaeon]
MGELIDYFFDTYALYEIIMGNKDYNKFSEKIGIITTKLNLMELHYTLLLDFGIDIANKYYNKFIGFTVDIDDETIIISNQFRASMKKRKMSYVDCLGYTIAKIRGVKFLTGDKEFFDLNNVEFVK